jgi:hypothetical protein
LSLIKRIVGIVFVLVLVLQIGTPNIINSTRIESLAKTVVPTATVIYLENKVIPKVIETKTPIKIEPKTASKYIPIPTKVININPLEELYVDDDNIYNGYFWDIYWVPGLPDYETQLTQTPPIVIGNAVAYGPGAMEATAKFRGLSLKGYVGGVSTISAANIGMSVWVKRPNNDWEGPFLVVDCSKRNDIYYHVRYMDLVVEVDYNIGRKWGLIKGNDEGTSWSIIKGKIDSVIVSKYPPSKTDTTKAVKILDWLLSIIHYDPYDTRYRGLVYKGGSTWQLDGKIITFQQPVP